MMRDLVLSSVLVASTLSGVPLFAQQPPSAADSYKQFDREQTQWIADALLAMQKIKPGMSRAKLMTVFTIEGGVSTAERQAFIYRKCPYIKVNVIFATVNPHQISADDKILEISTPYLAWSIAD